MLKIGIQIREKSQGIIASARIILLPTVAIDEGFLGFMLTETKTTAPSNQIIHFKENSPIKVASLTSIPQCLLFEAKT